MFLDFRKEKNSNVFKGFNGTGQSVELVLTGYDLNSEQCLYVQNKWPPSTIE
jgi:hypothetical protein